VAMRRNGVVTYLHGDHLGSTSLVTNDTGGFVARVLYYPYGETRYEAGPGGTAGTLPTDYQFTGQRKEGFGLYDYQARFYDPLLGRFVSADTIVPSAADGTGGGLATIGYSDQMRLTPLTVGFHETQFLGVVNAENQELLEFGQPALWGEQARQEHNVPMGPSNPQALNRYAYVLNNPLRYVDPSGHSNSGGNEDIGYEPLLNPDGTVIKDADGVTIYRIWYNGDEMYVRGDCPYLADFKRFADDYADGQVELLLGDASMYTGAALVGVGAVTLIATWPTGAGPVVGVAEIVLGVAGVGIGLAAHYHGENQIYQSRQNAYGTFWGEIHNSEYNVTRIYAFCERYQSGPDRVLRVPLR
jgi:RHS repeat-associated protein